MTQTLQLETRTIRQLHEAPKLLVEWSPRWEEFVTSIPPAFARSAPRLAGEAPLGGFDYRSMGTSFLLQVIAALFLIFVPGEIAHLRPYATPRMTPDEVIYYSADELPRTQDLSGAESGATGRAGGREAHHRTQTIRVARGASLTPRVVDAPNLKLPSSPGAVANLLAFKNVIPPPPAEGLHASHNGPRLDANVIAPSPNVTRDQSRSMTLNSGIIPPAPNVSSDRSRTVPSLNAGIVAPAPTVQSDHTLFAPRLDSSIIGPAPNVSSNNNRNAPSLSANVIAPASTRVSRDQARSAPSLNGRVITPAPSDVTHEVSPSRVQMNSIVVPPPVSAPERESTRTAKLNLPSPSVVAPPPSASNDREIRRLESGGVPSSAPHVIPPPPTQAANGSFVSSIIGKLFGTQEVVPPPPNVSSSAAGGSSRTSPNGGQGTSLNANVVPPPPSVGSAASGFGGSPTGRPQGGSNVIPPPPSVQAADGGSSGQVGGRQGSSLGASNVIPPPPSISGASQGSNSGRGQKSGGQNSGGSGNGTLLASNIIPPPPSADSGNGNSGYGRRGSGLGGPGDVGSVLAPPRSANSGEGSGVVLSTDPGSKPGLGNGGKGSLALSPNGGDKPGLGGNGGGTGIGNGTGPGSGLTGESTGAGRTGTGRGSDPSARGGISPTPGPGGAGTSPTGAPAISGVDVRGGSTSSVVNLPSFNDGSSNAPSLPTRSDIHKDEGPAITIVATSRSGGAFDFYGKLPGDNYTVYVDTNLGTVVMQFAEADPNSHAAGALTGPSGIRTDLPQNLPHNRVVIKCKLDATGNLKNIQVLEPGPAAMTAKIMAALPSWKFRPAQRGAQPVEVNALLGFNIDTNDRY
ncbi:MAG: hypothetical protein ABR874_21030 [Candidatus Sulfotelmatobacter sp.]